MLSGFATSETPGRSTLAEVAVKVAAVVVPVSSTDPLTPPSETKVVVPSPKLSAASVTVMTTSTAPPVPVWTTSKSPERVWPSTVIVTSSALAVIVLVAALNEAAKVPDAALPSWASKASSPEMLPEVPAVSINRLPLPLASETTVLSAASTNAIRTCSAFTAMSPAAFFSKRKIPETVWP